MGVETNLPEIGNEIIDFSVSLSVPALDPSSLDGDTGRVSLRALEKKNLAKLRNSRFTLQDTTAGKLYSRVSNLQWGEGLLSLDAETMLNRLTAVVTIPPQGSPLNTGMNNVLTLVGMSATGLGPAATVFPGWRGSLLDYLKYFCQVYLMEFVPSDTDPDVIVFRPIRQTMKEFPLTSASLSIDDQLIAEKVEVAMYEYSSFNTNYEFTPIAVDDMQILTVNPGETIEYDVQLNGWAASVNQPVPMDLVGPGERTDAGAYCVSGSDGLPIMAAQWAAQGGSLTVEVTEDPSILKVTLVAPAADTLPGVDGGDRFGPYSIAATTTEGQLYDSLHITGSGIRFTKTTKEFYTGTPQEVSRDSEGTLIENPWVSNVDRLFSLGVRAAQAYAGCTYTFQFASNNREAVRALVGARFPGDRVRFRVEEVTVTDSSTTFSGEMDTLFTDFNTAWTGKTFSDFSTANAGMTFDSWAAVPLNLVD